MTVTSTLSRADYTGNGAVSTFVVPFYFLDAGDLVVLLTTIATGTYVTLAQGTDYSVSGAGIATGGSITMLGLGANPVYPTSAQKVTILRQPPITQTTAYPTSGPFPAASHEMALDKLTMEMQELAEAQGRALTLSSSVGAPVAYTPVANGLVAMNSTNDGFTTILLSSVSTAAQTAYTRTNVTATAGQTLFTVPTYVQGVNGLLVWLNGSLLVAGSDYAETSTTSITLTSAAMLGDVLTAVAAGPVSGTTFSSGASTYTQGGTGAVANNVQAKLRERVSVKDFGAVGDGVANDTAAIQAAISASAAGTVPFAVYFPAGHYKITSSLTIQNYGISLVADWLGSAWIVQNTPANYSVSIIGASTSSTCQVNKIENLLFSGTSMGILLQNAEQVTINNCAFSSSTIGIDMSPVANTTVIKARITNCTFQNVTTGIHGGSTRQADSMVVNNYFIDCAGYAIDLGLPDGGNFSGNAIFSSISDNAGNGGFRLAGGHFLHICENQFFGVNGYALYLTSPGYVTITGNVFANCGAVSTNASQYFCIAIGQYSNWPCNNNLIAGNKFYECAAPAFNTTYLNDSTVRDNEIYCCGQSSNFTGTISGTVLTLTAAAQGNFLANGTQYLAVGGPNPLVPATTAVAQGVTISSLAAGVLGQVGSTYNLSGTPSGGNVVSATNMSTGLSAVDAFIFSGSNEIRFDGNKVDGGAFTRYYVNISTCTNFRMGVNTWKNTVQADMYAPYAGSTIFFDNNPTPAVYSPSVSSLTPKSTDTTILVSNGYAGTCTVNLGSAVAYAGKTYTVVKTDASVNALSLSPAAGTINGSATLSLATQWTKATIVSNGSNWVQIG